MLSMLCRSRASSAGIGARSGTLSGAWSWTVTSAILGGAGPGSGALLAGRALVARRLARHQRRVDVLQHDLARDDDPCDVVAARHLEHHLLEDLLHDRPQTAR